MIPFSRYAILVILPLATIIGASAFYLLHSAEPAQCQGPYGVLIPPNSAQTPDADECRGSPVGSITYQYLSSEGSDPFTRKKRLPRSEDSFYRRDYENYSAALERFPDAGSCLIDSEQKKDAPDLALFEWSQIYSIQDAEVCLFRIFSSIRSAGESVKWLKSQGFRTAKAKNAHDAYGDERIEATWNLKRCGPRWETRVACDENDISYSIGLEAGFSADGSVAEISLGYTIF